jgi:hypothetical protein
MSVNKLGGLCLIIGPVMALIFYMIQPGNMIVSPADTGDAQASMDALKNNAMLTSLCALLVPLGLILWLYGIRALYGNGEETGWGRLGVQFILIATIGWVASLGLQHVVVVGPGNDMAAYTVSAALNNMSGLVAALGVLILSLALSSREGINKIFPYIVAITAVAAAIMSILMILDPAMSEKAAMVGGIAYMVWTIWFILGGLSLIKQG